MEEDGGAALEGKGQGFSLFKTAAIIEEKGKTKRQQWGWGEG